MLYPFEMCVCVCARLLINVETGIIVGPISVHHLGPLPLGPVKRFHAYAYTINRTQSNQTLNYIICITSFWH